MINSDRVRDMTWLAVFEKKEGKKTFRITKYFQRDYVGLALLKGFIAATFSYVVGLGVWGVYNMELLMDTIHTMDIPAFGKKLAIIYFAVVAVYMLLMLIYSEVTYKRARRRARGYARRLKHLIKGYEENSNDKNS